MAIGMVETIDWRARHQEVLQNAVVDRNDGPGEHAFVIVFVVAVEIDASDALQCGVEGDCEEIREDLFADFLSEGLTFGFVFLAMTFDAMTEDFVEKDAGRATGKNRGSHKGFGDRSLQEIFDVGGNLLNGGAYFLIVGKTVGVEGFKGIEIGDVHAVLRFGAG